MSYSAGVVSDEDLSNVRGSRSYRASIWMARLNFILLGLALWLGRGHSVSLFLIMWLLLAVSIVTGLALLRRSGVPFVRVGLSWRVRDARMTRQIYKDVVWFRRR